MKKLKRLKEVKTADERDVEGSPSGRFLILRLLRLFVANHLGV
jgi:hypothetical protein